MSTDHALDLTSPGFVGGSDAPFVMKRTDQRFMAGLMHQLGTSHEWPRLRAMEVDDGVLYQPNHRTFHIAVADAFCDVVGRPRIDPRSIDSAGLVLRREVVDDEGRKLVQGWMIRGDQTIAGWTTLSQQAQLLDPDPERRRIRSPLKNPVLDARLRDLNQADIPLREHCTPVFVAPPIVNEASGRTLVFGLLPMEEQEVEEEIAPPKYTRADIAARVPPWFDTNASALSVPYAGYVLRRVDQRDPLLLVGAPGVRATQLRNPETALAVLQSWTSKTQAKSFGPYLRFLQQVAVEFDLLGASEASHGVRQQVDRAKVIIDGVEVPATQHLREVIDVVLLGKQGTVVMPTAWVDSTSEARTDLIDALRGLHEQRFETIRPRRRKFAVRDARYTVRIFLRVKQEPGCPDVLVWSRPAGPYQVAAWWDSGPVPPPVVTMPNILEPGFFDKIKPNVAFEVPAGLFELLATNSAEDFMDGKAKTSTGIPTIDWICGFNIPIITICAFILLWIMLYILNWIFWWLPFVRVCFPMPGSWKKIQ